MKNIYIETPEEAIKPITIKHNKNIIRDDTKDISGNQLTRYFTKIITQYHPSAKLNNHKKVYAANYYTYDTNNKEKCIVCERIHDRLQPYIVLFNDSRFYYGCYSNTSSLCFMGYIKEDKKRYLTNVTEISRPYLTYSVDNKIVDITDDTPDPLYQAINKWYMSDDKSLAFKAKTGMGKTTIVSKILNDSIQKHH